MTSEQVMLALVALLMPILGGCSVRQDAAETPVPRLIAPYEGRQVWAVAPLRNESGSLQANGVRVADHLARQLEQAEGIDAVPVTRVIAAMDALKMPTIGSPQQAMQLRQTLGVDAIVVGTISTYDPYDPPKLGLALELYVDEQRALRPPVDVRGLSRAGTDQESRLANTRNGQPTSVVSGLYDAAEPATRQWLQRYSLGRGTGEDRPQWRTYRISMDLYTEFVSYAVSWRLLHAEGRRVRDQEPQAERVAPEDGATRNPSS